MSYYKTINKVKYDRNLLELADSMVAKERDGRISIDDAKALYEATLDGDKITVVEARTLAYVIAKYNCSDASQKWLNEQLATRKNATSNKNVILTAGAVNSIRTLLKIADDGSIPKQKLIIDKSTLTSIDNDKVVSAVIATAFNNKSIIITKAKANPISSGSDVIITGTGKFDLLSSEVATTLTLKMVGSNVQALCEYTVIGSVSSPTSWKFSDSFPNLPGVLDASKPGSEASSPLDALSMTNAAFLISTCFQSVDNQSLIEGVNFRADLKPSGILSVFEEYIVGKSQLKLQGTIVLLDPSVITPPIKSWEFPWDLKGIVPGINIKVDLGIAPIKLASMTFAAEYFRIYSPGSKAWFSKNSTFKTIVGYTGEFDIPSAKSKIEVVAVSPIGAKAAKLIANFDNSPIGNFSELADIIGIKTVSKSFPSKIQSGDLGGLGIKGASVTIGYDKKINVSDVSVTVGMPKLDWEIWPDHFSVDSVTAIFDVQNPFQSKTRAIDILVTGVLEVEGVEVDISAHKSTGFEIIASTPNQFDIPLSKLMSTYAPGIPPVSDLTIDAFELMVSPGNFYSIMLQMAQKPHPWIIPLGVTKLEFSDVGMFLLKPKSGDLSGSFSGNAEIAGVNLNARYDIPGDILVRGDFPTVTLSEMVSYILKEKINVPDGFDLSFSKSFVLLQKKGSDYKMELGTVIDGIASLVFVLEKGSTGWGFATGLQVALNDLDKLPGGVGKGVKDFTSWFPFQTFTLAISTLQDESFTFPGFQTFKQKSLGKTNIKLPAIAKGIQPGFFLYTSTEFTRKNHILAALIDIFKIPEGTQLDGFVAYLTNKKQFQLGISLTTFLTPVKKISDRTCAGHLGYQNTCLSGTIMLMAGGPDGFAFSLIASLKTIIDKNDIEFDVILSVVENGVFASGTMKVVKPIPFGPFQLGGVALELGISFEGIPSFGFSGELMVEDLFDSSLAVMVNTSNPADSMISGALSDISLGDVVAKLVGEVNDELPKELKLVLDQVAIEGAKDGAFTVKKGAQASNLEDALNNFKGDLIQSDFVKIGKQSSFPRSSDGMMIFNDSSHGKWYITEKGGSGESSTVTHWQLIKNKKGEIEVSKEAQFYFVPSPAGVSIGTFFYPQGFKISGRLDFFFIKAEVDIEIELDKGFKVDAQLDKISFLSDSFFSIKAEEGPGGPQVSICTYKQPAAPKKFQNPHFFVNGKGTILGSSFGAFADINTSGASFKIEGSSLIGILKSELSGTFSDKLLKVGGKIHVGIGTINLGKLGSWEINTGVFAEADIFADLEKGHFGADFDAGFELGGDIHSIGKISLDVNVGKLADLTHMMLEDVKKFLVKLFTDPKYWAELAAKVLGWVKSEVEHVLENVFGLTPKEVKAIIEVISAFCPIINAVGMLGVAS